ncbi:hypothetical protein MMC09_006105 [Bachmanniomyces sp. S44760]|nr:hypothetical protein [Bachmanniomyces sp. S44760]
MTKLKMQEVDLKKAGATAEERQEITEYLMAAVTEKKRNDAYKEAKMAQTKEYLKDQKKVAAKSKAIKKVVTEFNRIQAGLGEPDGDDVQILDENDPVSEKNYQTFAAGMHLLETAQGPEVTDLFEHFADVAPPQAATAPVSSMVAARQEMKTPCETQEITTPSRTQEITTPSETQVARRLFSLVPAMASAISRRTGVSEPVINKAYALTICALIFLAWLCLLTMLNWALRTIDSKESAKFQINRPVQDILSKIGHEDKIMLTYLIEGHRIVENFVNVLNN